jgi:hypothetical protein
MNRHIQEDAVRRDILTFISFIQTVHGGKITMYEIQQAIQEGGYLHRLTYPNLIVGFAMKRKIIQKQGDYLVLI